MVDLNKISAKTRTRRSRGASMVEFALLVLLISILAKGAVGVVGVQLSDSFTQAKSQIAGAGDVDSCEPGAADWPQCRMR